MGLVISLSQVMILHQFYVIIVELEHVASIMKVVILSNPLQHVVVRQGELQLSKQFFFTETLAAACCNSPGRVVTEPEIFKFSPLNLFHWCLFFNAYTHNCRVLLGFF